MGLIDKSAVKAEIERRILEDYNTGDVEMDEVAQGVLASFKYFIDTLEVKETPDSANLEEEIENELERTWYGEYLDTDKFKESAVYFYELGLKAKGE
jgi:hypothetical protein